MLDYEHKLMEFDTDGALAHSLGGHHVPLRRETVGSDPQYANLAVHASVNDNGQRAMDFMLDSGAASLVLFGGIEKEGDRISERLGGGYGRRPPVWRMFARFKW